MNSFFRLKNMNPWGKRIDDCAIRAVSAALQMKYNAVCKLFGKECKEGHGLAGKEGISLKLIKHRLSKFFDRVEDAFDTAWDKRPPEFEDVEFDPAIDADPDLGIDLDDFCDMYAGTGRYLVSLVPSRRMKVNGVNFGHIVYANLKPGCGWFYDTWDCSKMMVEAYMRVKYILNPEDPRSLLYRK